MRIGVLLVLMLALLTGCRYTFIPLIPPKATGTIPVRLKAELVRDGDDLLLSATLDDPQARGYLEVRWYREGTPLGQDSSYLDAAGSTARFRLNAPERASGYRAVLSFGGAVLRQLDYSDPAK